MLEGDTSKWTGRGWCVSSLDEFPSSGETTDSPEACWTECLAEYKDDLVAIDWRVAALQGEVTKAKRAHNPWRRRITKDDVCLRNIYLN